MLRREFIRFFSVASAAVAATASSAFASSPASRDNFVISDIRDKSNKMLSEIMKSNEYYKKTKTYSFFQGFVASQAPRVTLVACSDSRFQVAAIDDTPENDIFVIRNIGNQFSSNMGSVEYGVHHLHTPLLVILGHSRCGAIKAAMSDYSGEGASIRKDLDSLSVSINKAKKASYSKDEWLNGVVSNVHQQVAFAKSEFAEAVESGKLTIVGMVYDFANDFRDGYGKVKVVNANGETDLNKIKEMPVFRGVL